MRNFSVRHISMHKYSNLNKLKSKEVQILLLIRKFSVVSYNISLRIFLHKINSGSKQFHMFLARSWRMTKRLASLWSQMKPFGYF